MTPPPILIAGATASGKSALARQLAAERPSVIVNADALQVYRELRILTARPTAAEESATPHRLYGHVAATERYSVGRWLADVALALAEAAERDWQPIIVGGTGLYLQALTAGLAPVPAIPPDLRRAWASRAAVLPTIDLHRLLAERSPSEAARVRPTDRTRILRALEVIDATGRTLPQWQADPAPAPLVDPSTARRILLEVERPELHRRIESRLRAMVEAGALAEAAAIEALRLDPELPAMKAVGLRPLLRHRRSELDLEGALAAAMAETRQYAKRQLTWFRHQMPGWAG